MCVKRQLEAIMVFWREKLRVECSGWSSWNLSCWYSDPLEHLLRRHSMFWMPRQIWLIDWTNLQVLLMKTLNLGIPIVLQLDNLKFEDRRWYCASWDAWWKIKNPNQVGETGARGLRLLKARWESLERSIDQRWWGIGTCKTWVLLPYGYGNQVWVPPPC